MGWDGCCGNSSVYRGVRDGTDEEVPVFWNLSVSCFRAGTRGGLRWRSSDMVVANADRLATGVPPVIVVVAF